MSGEPKRLEEQLRRAHEGEAWHGPSLLEALAGVSAEQAAARPIAGAHSIWELVLHLGSDYSLVLRRLSGDGRQLTPAIGACKGSALLTTAFSGQAMLEAGGHAGGGNCILAHYVAGDPRVL